MSSLPECISDLVNLEILDIGSANLSNRNGLTALPDNIGELVNLKELYLQYNALSTLPDSIGNLVNLKILDLLFIQFDSLPDSICNLKELDRFIISDNKNINFNPSFKIIRWVDELHRRGISRLKGEQLTYTDYD